MRDISVAAALLDGGLLPALGVGPVTLLMAGRLAHSQVRALAHLETPAAAATALTPVDLRVPTFAANESKSKNKNLIP